MNSRWKTKRSNLEKFLKGNKDWLKKTVTFPLTSIVTVAHPRKRKISPNINDRKPFSELSERSKNRKSKDLRDSDSSPEVQTYSAAYKFLQQGNKDAAIVLHDIACNSPATARRYRENFINKAGTMTPEKALAHLLDCQLSRHRYQIARNTFINMNNPGYPPYKKVLEVKKACYPKNMCLKGHSARVPLQHLCDHTIERLCLYLKEVIDQLSSHELSRLKFFCKYGSDGSSSQSNYKQKFTDDNGLSIDDSSLYISSMVPLQLVVVGNNNNTDRIIWANDKPSSPMYCRPIHIIYSKETPELMIEEKEVLENQIKNIEAHTFDIENSTLQVSYEFIPTMYDVKSINKFTNTEYTKECYLCGLRGSELNDLEKILNTPIVTANLKYGMSSLHAWIRCFEFLVHVSYKLSICQYNAYESDGTKEMVEQHKKYIQKQFKDGMHLKVDQPKQGAGNSNDGNTARAFFSNPEKSAKVTGLDIEVIERFHVILETISSGHIVDHEKYKTFAFETAQLFIRKYSWFIMSPTVHKVLCHGAKIIENAPLPIGQLSEEAAESNNKYARQFRLFFTRKSCRELTMTDLFYRLLANSDPYIASLRHFYKKPFNILSSRARAMLKAPSTEKQNVEISETVSEMEKDIEDYPTDMDECDMFFNIEEIIE